MATTQATALPDTVELDATRRRIFETTKNAILTDIRHYGGDPKAVLETRHWEKLDAILDAPDRLVALQVSEQAREKVRMTLLSMWSTKRLPGPNTPENLERKARKAENIEKLLESKGEYEKVEKQKKRVQELRAKAQQLREGQAPISVPKKPRKRRKRT